VANWDLLGDLSRCVHLKKLRVVWRLRNTSVVECPEFRGGNCEIKNHSEDRNKVRCALQAKKGRGKGLQIVGVTDRAGRIGGTIRSVKLKVEVIRGGVMTVEYREEDQMKGLLMSPCPLPLSGLNESFKPLQTLHIPFD